MSTIYADDITMVFPGTVALDHVSCSFEGGKINALLGKNGSGKSTLMKIFAGATKMTSGRILLDNQEMHFNNTIQATEAGIVMVYQETSLVPTMSVMENIFLGRPPKKKSGLIDWKAAKEKSKDLLNEMGVDIDPQSVVLHLPMWKRQVVEICKALSNDPKVLILDEPTSALAKNEVEKLFAAIRKIREKGVVIIYISHKLAEVSEISDTVTVIRDGVYIGKKDTAELSNAEMVRMMFGNVENKVMPPESTAQDEIIMEVKGLTREGWFQDVNFKLFKGEVLGIAGVLGSGRLFKGNGFPGIPIPVIIFLVMWVIFYIIMEHTTTGRAIYAIGGNQEAARLSGVSVFKTKMVVFISVQICAVIAGWLNSAMVMNADWTYAKDWPTDCITMVIIGGTSMTGGNGRIFGTLIGVILISVLINGMTILNWNIYIQYIVRGGILLGSLLLMTYRDKMRD